MENRRFFLFAVFGALLFFTYQTWKKDFPDTVSTPPAAVAKTSAAPAIVGEDSLPAAPAATVSALGTAPETLPAAVDSNARITVLTDKLRIEISLAGGDLRRAELIGYPISKDRPKEDLALLDDRDPHYFILQSGLASAEKPLISTTTVFTAAANSYVLPSAST